MAYEPKVFGIGFHKTATSSLGAALDRLGYRVCSNIETHTPGIGENVYEEARRRLGRFDAFEDNPWPVLFRELDEWCPGSSFILTWRSPERWLQSALDHFGEEDTPMRKWIYGPEHGHPKGNEEVYLQRYKRHNEAVRDYFADRPDDLLELDITAGEGWEKLCPFLNEDVIDEPFPHQGRKEERASLIKKVWARLT
jgi:hypothetical protein